MRKMLIKNVNMIDANVNFQGDLLVENGKISKIDSNINISNSEDIKIIDDKIEYSVDEKIEFDPYGEGVIISVEDKVLIVAFKHPHGIKMLMKGHGKIRKVKK